MENIRKYSYVLLLLGFIQVSGVAQSYSKMSQDELNKALIIAVKDNSSDEVHNLIQAGAHVHQKINPAWPEHSHTLLGYAAVCNYVDSVKELVQKAESDDIDKAFVFAVELGHIDVVRELIKAGANSDQKMSYIEYGDMDRLITCTPLEYATKRGYVGIIKELLQLKTKHDDIDVAFMLAVEKGHLDVVRELLQVGVEVDSINKALIDAAEDLHLSMIEALIEAGAHVNYVNQLGNTALICAVHCDRFTEAGKKHKAKVIQTLLESGANVAHANKNGRTALMEAVIEHDLNTVQSLLQVHKMTTGSYFGFGTKPINYADNDGNTALILALKYVRCSYIVGNDREYNDCLNSQNIIQILVETPGIDVHYVNRHGETAIALLEKLHEQMSRFN